jgi:RNA polymerase sigma-70 factor (ECF subfamily)
VPFDSDFPTLLAAARQGAEWAWTNLYREYSPALLRYLRAQGAREPEDLLGEVFVQVVRNLATFDGAESAFRSWVFMIARNRLIDERRRSGRNPVEPAPDSAIAELAGSGHAEDDALRRISDARVIEVLGRLTADQRDVLFLRLFARMTAEEIAAVIGKRRGAVKALQSRALSALRREISR